MGVTEAVCLTGADTQSDSVYGALPNLVPAFTLFTQGVSAVLAFVLFLNHAMQVPFSGGLYLLSLLFGMLLPGQLLSRPHPAAPPFL